MQVAVAIDGRPQDVGTASRDQPTTESVMPAGDIGATASNNPSSDMCVQISMPLYVQVINAVRDVSTKASKDAREKLKLNVIKTIEMSKHVEQCVEYDVDTII